MNLMNKNEQAQLCMLLAKMRYDIMKLITDNIHNKTFVSKQDEILSAINKVISYSYIDGNIKNE